MGGFVPDMVQVPYRRAAKGKAMRILGVTETCDLGSLYLRLLAEGHDVRVAVSHELAQGTMAGLIPRTANWRGELAWVREAGDEGIILFEAVSEGLGALQDELRRQGYHVIGGSALGDRLENDRHFALGLLADLGLSAGERREFASEAAALAFLDTHPGRYVLKFSGPGHASSDNYVGMLSSGEDVRAILRGRLGLKQGEDSRFILMPFYDGVEMGVGAFFDGHQFLTPACLDWEHKRFFAGDMGELTGEMGTVATYDRTGTFFERTLARLAPALREAGHVGYVNLNTIVNRDGIWPLELTCRFGYPGYSVLEPLQATPWGELLRAMVSRGPSLETRPGFSVGVVVTTPPFPYSREEVDEVVGLPIFHHGGPGAALIGDPHIHPGEVGLADGRLVTSGLYGWTIVVTGAGATVPEAKAAAYRRLDGLMVPHGRWRLDIGDRVAAGQIAEVEALGLLDPE